jgi:uncharacterized protein YbaR (Trm112 family)
MRRDLLDALRCPAVHDESWLVAVVHEAHDGRLLEADLACPVCGAEFRVTGGTAYFGPSTRVAAGSHEALAAAPDPARLAALLGVTHATAPLLLGGHYTRAGAALSAVVEAPQLWLDAPDNADIGTADVSRFAVLERLPLGVDTLAGAAVDAAHAQPALLGSIRRALKVGARLVAPAATPLPAGLRELARDDEEWVAEVTTRASGLVELRRGS